MTTLVKCESHLSALFVIRQGVCRGGILSTSHYKRYNNQHLIVLEHKYSGMVIGSICVPHITVADDTALITSSEDEMQGMVEDTESQLIRKGMLSIRPEVVCCHTTMVPDQHVIMWALIWVKKIIKFENHCNHLGIYRDIKQTVNIVEKISIGMWS